MESFASLGLSEAIVRAVAEKGYTEPTPVQLQAIPVILAGKDLMAGAQTGTGKTAGFTLPILQRLSETPPSSEGAKVRALILTPTRELAAQVEESVRVYGGNLNISSMTLFGGVGIHPQIDRLKQGVDVVVATPGRLLDHLGQGTIDLSGVEILVLDEADRMLDMGFIKDIRKILALLPAKRQNLLFSATFSGEIRSLADGLLSDPAQIQTTPVNTMAEGVKQIAYAVDRERKRELLTHLITSNEWFQILIFTRTKHGANRLAQQLSAADLPALAIHGNKSQSARTRALTEFKSGTLRVLVATDIAARGIDIKELPHVVNYDLPNVPEDYVHRIGRTGRAGADGEAISLVSIDDATLLKDIERFTGHPISTQIMPGFEPDPNAKAEPQGLRGRGRQLDEEGEESGEANLNGIRGPRNPRRGRGPRHRGAPLPGQVADSHPNGEAMPPRLDRGPRPPRPPKSHGVGPARGPRPHHDAQRGPRRNSFEHGGQPTDNSNRSPTVLAGGRDRPRQGFNAKGSPRHSNPHNVNFDPNRQPAPSELVAILQGKRPTSVIEGIPEEDRLELGLGQGRSSHQHPPRHAQTNGNVAPPRGTGEQNGQKRHGHPRHGNRPKNGARGPNGSHPNRGPSHARPMRGGSDKASIERPLHERFPGLPRDEE
jgi:ATP-dependent RNA helicase RhlE